MMEIILGNKTSWKVLRLMNENRGRGTAKKEIRHILGTGSFALDEMIERLVASKVLLKSKIGRESYYKLNLSSELTMRILSLLDYERQRLNALPPSMVSRIDDFIIRLLEAVKPAQIILFGSYAKYTHDSASDADLAIITEEEIQLKQRLEINRIAAKSQKSGLNLQLHYFTANQFSSLAKKKEKIAIDILKDGLVFLG
jgi:predicted nucleotidyltransferase